MTATQDDERPAFKRTQSEPDLPVGQRLNYEDDLIGHTIKAVFECPGGRLGGSDTFVIVTESDCWALLKADGGYGDELPSIQVESQRNRYGTSDDGKRLEDILSALELRNAGLINSSEFELLRLKELELERQKKKLKAERLRKQAEDLLRQAEGAA